MASEVHIGPHQLTLNTILRENVGFSEILPRVVNAFVRPASSSLTTVKMKVIRYVCE